MSTHVLSSAQHAEAERIWTRLERELPEPGLMCTWDWTGTWLAHYGALVPHRFILAERDGANRAIALITEPAGLGRLRPPTIALGTAGEPPGSSVFVERNRLLVGEQDRGAFAAALLAELERDGRWQRLRLDGVLAEDGELLLGERPAARRRVEDCPIADLQAGEPDDVLSALSASRRARARRALRHFGQLDTAWAQSAAEADSMLDELIALHTARWQREGQPGAFADPRFTAFHRELIARLVPEGRAALFRIRRGQETVACLYGLIEGRRMLFYQGGLRHYEDNRLRVGIAAHALFMQACRDRGLRKYDFLAPAARYKTDLSTACEQLVWAELERPGARLHLEGAARTIRHGLRADG